MAERSAKRNLFDELVRQRLRAEQAMAPVDPSLDPAAVSERERREREAAAAQQRTWSRNQETWLASMVRLLPSNVRVQAEATIGRLTAAQVRERLIAGTDMAAWRRIQAQQIQGMRALLRDQRRQLERAREAVGNVVAYVVRAPRSEVREAVVKRPAGPNLRGLLESWRDPHQLRIFLGAHADSAPGADRAVDLARSVATRRSQLLARVGQQRAAAGRRQRIASAGEDYDLRRERGYKIRELARPQERTMRNRAMPKDLAAYHRTARNRAIRRSARWWRAAHGLSCAHIFAVQPIAISHGDGARVIYANGVDCSSPASMALSFSNSCADNKAADLLHLMVSLPAGFAKREDVGRQLLYQGFRMLGRLAYDPTDHRCAVILHTDRAHHHIHFLLDKTRLSDGARITSPAMHHWRATNLESALLTRESSRYHGLPDDESATIDPIGGFDGASRAGSAALERSSAIGSIRMTDGSVRKFDLYAKSASARIMGIAGTPPEGDRLPGGIAKTIPVAVSVDELIEYVLRKDAKE